MQIQGPTVLLDAMNDTYTPLLFERFENIVKHILAIIETVILVLL